MPPSLKTFALLLGAIVPTAAIAAEPAPPAVRARVPWTTSRVVGSPDPPPPFKVVRAFPNLKFDKPLLLARLPSSDRLFIGEQGGKIYSFANSPDAQADLFCDLRQELTTLKLHPGAQSFDNLYGFVFHPDFVNNRQCFICYTLKSNKSGERNLKDGSRVSRFTVTKSDPPRIDPTSEQVVFTYLQGGHNGGDLHFGPDGFLYISTGDSASPNPPDPLGTGQDISDHLSSILRIDVNRQEADKHYAIPPDNPFISFPNARPEVWAYGFRNPWRMSFDRQTGELYVGDVGWELWELVHRIEKGGNYGWSAMEGPQPVNANQHGPTPIIPALLALPHTLGASVTGGYVYRGRKFPELQGAYVFGDWETRRLWAARFEGDRTKEMPELTRPSVRVSAFGEDNAGEIYFLDHDVGTIHTLERNDLTAQNADFPTRLSQTGLFMEGTSHQPVPGVLPFAINARQWQDGATAEHFVAFPGDSFATLYAKAKPIPGMVNWHNFRLHFPENAVLARTISLAGRRLETQLLHYDGLDWQPYTYVWRPDQSDGDLVPADGGELELTIDNEKHIWPLQSRTQCRLCHSSWSEYALAFQPEQLNRPGAGGHNQLVSLSELGLIRRVAADGKQLPAFDAESATRERQLADPADEKQPLEARARAYLHANCGHCHAFGGGGAVELLLQFPTPASDMRALGVPPARGNFSLPGACIIKPGDPLASTLYFRMAKFGKDRMPHLGSERIDEAGLKLIDDWITSLEPSSPKTDSDRAAAETVSLLTDPQTALVAARRLGRGELPPAERDALLTAAAALPSSPIRDLFEGYFPADAHDKKLGSSPRPRTILALAGDSTRGEQLFWSTAVNCGSCHKIGNRGVTVGPDLSAIGKQRTREDLLDSLLEPSRRIEPKFAAYIARATDGRIITGLVVNRDASGAILRDAQNKEITLPTADIDQLQPSRRSLMPDNQMASLTKQQAVDLLAYLSSRLGP